MLRRVRNACPGRLLPNSGENVVAVEGAVARVRLSSRERGRQPTAMLLGACDCARAGASDLLHVKLLDLVLSNASSSSDVWRTLPPLRRLHRLPAKLLRPGLLGDLHRMRTAHVELGRLQATSAAQGSEGCPADRSRTEPGGEVNDLSLGRLAWLRLATRAAARHAL